MELVFHNRKKVLNSNDEILTKISLSWQDYDAQDLQDFEETILRGVDYNQDGKINRKELTMILLALAKHNQEEDTTA